MINKIKIIYGGSDIGLNYVIDEKQVNIKGMSI